MRKGKIITTRRATMSSTATAAAPENNGRDPQGRFAKCNPGGPGNPFARAVAKLRSALIKSVQPDDVVAIARAMIDKAKGGDVAAARLVFSYVLGKPAETVNPDRVDMDEWQIYRETTPLMKELPEVAVAPSPELPLKQVRDSRPIMTEVKRAQIHAALVQLAAEMRACQTTPNSDSPPSTNRDNGEWVQPDPPLDRATWEALFGDEIPWPVEENPDSEGQPAPSPRQANSA
jgi:hypothetical protein